MGYTTIKIQLIYKTIVAGVADKGNKFAIKPISSRKVQPRLGFLCRTDLLISSITWLKNASNVTFLFCCSLNFDDSFPTKYEGFLWKFLKVRHLLNWSEMAFRISNWYFLQYLWGIHVVLIYFSIHSTTNWPNSSIIWISRVLQVIDPNEISNTISLYLQWHTSDQPLLSQILINTWLVASVVFIQEEAVSFEEIRRNLINTLCMKVHPIWLWYSNQDDD